MDGTDAAAATARVETRGRGREIENQRGAWGGERKEGEMKEKGDQKPTVGRK